MTVPRCFGLIVASVTCTVLWSQEPASRPLAPSPASIAPPENAARVQLDRAASLLRNGSSEEAIETFRRVVATHGEELIEWPCPPGSTPREFTRYGTVRELAWMTLATLHRSAPRSLAAFRRQIDPQARRWLEPAADPFQRPNAQRIVDELFLSSLTDEALLRLGDEALERGDTNAARRSWERIAPGLRFAAMRQEPWIRAAHRPLWLPFLGVDVAASWSHVAPWFANPGEATELIYPDTNLDVASIRARLALASILEGNLERARIELSILRQVAPSAAGTIGGRTGPFVELVQEFLAQEPHWLPRAAESDWPTWAGSPARNRVAPSIGELSEKPLWSISLPQWSAAREMMTRNRVRVAEDGRGLLPYHPLIVGNWAIVQTQPNRDQVQAYQLQTGEPVLPATEEGATVPGTLDRAGLFGVPRFTPTARGKILYLVEGFTIQEATGAPQRTLATLVAIDLAAERKLLWRFTPPPSDGSGPFVLAGPPTADRSRVYVTLRRREAARDETHVAALDARDGRVLWKQFLGVAEPAVDVGWSALTHQLLTVAHDTVYCNTNAGLVAALDTRTGRVRWMSSYPRSGYWAAHSDRNDLHLYRDLNPCLIDRDLVVVAPTDCNRIFALDATTGITLWVTPAELAADAVHLLGVSENRVVASGECVYWFDARTGHLVGRFPGAFKAAPGFARPSPRGYGRGILAGAQLYWPTRDAILVFDHRPTAGTWQPSVQRTIPLAERGATGGNLVLARETLLIAGADRLFAFSAKPIDGVR